MTIADIVSILDAGIVCGASRLDTEVHNACGSDMMSDVLAFVKDQSVLLTGLVNPQVVRTADMMDMTKAVQLTLRAAQQTLTVEGNTEFRSMRVVVRGKSATLALGSVKSGSAMESSVTLNLSYILVEVGGESLIELDKLNPTFKVRGVDILQKVREMI